MAERKPFLKFCIIIYCQLNFLTRITALSNLCFCWFKSGFHQTLLNFKTRHRFYSQVAMQTKSRVMRQNAQTNTQAKQSFKTSLWRQIRNFVLTFSRIGKIANAKQWVLCKTSTAITNVRLLLVLCVDEFGVLTLQSEKEYDVITTFFL